MPLDPLQKANFRTHEHTADQIIDSSTGSPINVGGGTASIEYVIDGGGAAVTTGSKGYLSIPFAATVTKVRELPDDGVDHGRRHPDYLGGHEVRGHDPDQLDDGHQRWRCP